MTILSCPNERLRKGMVLALPMGRRATITTDPTVGTKFVSFTAGQYGPTRVERTGETLIDVARCPACGSTAEHHLAYVLAHGVCVV